MVTYVRVPLGRKKEFLLCKSTKLQFNLRRALILSTQTNVENLQEIFHYNIIIKDFHESKATRLQQIIRSGEGQGNTC